jgi:hypothetical protein
MACLALSCFLVVVWLAALPEGSGRSMAAMERDEIMSTRGFHDLGDGIGAGLLWLYDEPTPMVGYGTDKVRRQADDAHEGRSFGSDPSHGDVEDGRGDDYANRSDDKDVTYPVRPSPVADAAAVHSVSPNGQAQMRVPGHVSASSGPSILARNGLAEPKTPSPTPAPSTSTSFVKIKRAAPSATSSTFSSPPFADQPSAQMTDGPDDGDGDDGASTLAAASTPSDASGSQKTERRRSRVRRSGHQ